MPGRDDIAHAIHEAYFGDDGRVPAQGEFAAADAVVPLLAAAHAEGVEEGVQAATRAIETLQARAEPYQQTRGGGPYSAYGVLGDALAALRLLANEAHE